MARVLLVDDQPIVRRGIAELLESCGHDVIFEADGAEEAIENLVRIGPELAVVDLALGDGPDGIQLTKALVTGQPGLPVVILSGHDEALFAERALQAGASAYVMKDAGVPALIEAIDCVLAGHLWLSQKLRAELAVTEPRIDVELGADADCVLKHVRRGARGKWALTRRLGWTLGRAERALTEVMRRLGMPSEVALYLWADEEYDLASAGGEMER